MSDRGPSGQDPDPTEFFPPLPPEAPTGPVDLPPIGSDRDPEPTRVMPPAPPPPTVTQYPPTTVVPPTGGGPYDPGPPYGGGGGGAGGGAGGPGGPGGPYGEAEPNPEPDPWYRQPGPLAALIAGVAAVIVAVIALLVWTSGDDEDSDGTLPTVVATTAAPTTAATTVPATTTTSTVPATTTSTTSTTTTSTTSTTTSTTTTTTLPPTTTTTPPTTTLPPTTTTTPPPPTTVPPPVTVPLDPDATMWDLIQADPSLTKFREAVVGSNTQDLFEDEDNYTVLAPVNDAFAGQTGQFDVNDYLIPGNLSIPELFNLREVEVVGGATLAVDPANWTVGGARVTTSSEAANGQVNAVTSFVTPD
ncbi:MAG: fasciclin domain-containing protein [Ilumatobacteraceae bacterium]